MLVDNGVAGDSRVQKTARSAAAAGWDVILVGLLGPNATQDAWRVGEAEVRLIKLKRSMLQRPSRYRRSLLRRPLAYPPGRLAEHRMQWVRARRAEMRLRLAAAEAFRRSGAPRWLVLARKGLLLPTRVFNKVLARWVRFRKDEQKRLQAARANPRAPLNRLTIGFWKTLRRDRAWRNLDPGLYDYELSLGGVVDRLEPDLIHANDFRMIAVGARAVQRARGDGRDVKLVWDAHEFVAGLPGRPDNPEWLPAQVMHEREYARFADAVLTVSPALADLLRESHRLPEQPSVVLNAPDLSPSKIHDDGPMPDLRALCDVSASTPLLVYCGGITPIRGVDVMVEALTQLPDVHVALVSLPPNGKRAAADVIAERAAELDVADRVHLLPYVAHWQVVPLLRGADAAVSPLLHLPNHEIALSNKFFEYSQARLPLIVSDVRTMAEMVRSTGQGEVFRAGDVDDYVRAVRAVLANRERYTPAYDAPGMLAGWTWQAQAEVIEAVYRRLLPDRSIPVARSSPTTTATAEPVSAQ
jgi:glycogen synthase